MRAGSSHRSGTNASASGPHTRARRLTVREGMWMTWPFVTGMPWRMRLPSGERTGQRRGITSSFSTTFSVCEDEGKMRSLVWVRPKKKKSIEADASGPNERAYPSFTTASKYGKAWPSHISSNVGSRPNWRISSRSFCWRRGSFAKAHRVKWTTEEEVS